MSVRSLYKKPVAKKFHARGAQNPTESAAGTQGSARQRSSTMRYKTHTLRDTEGDTIAYYVCDYGGRFCVPDAKTSRRPLLSFDLEEAGLLMDALTRPEQLANACASGYLSHQLRRAVSGVPFHENNKDECRALPVPLLKLLDPGDQQPRTRHMKPDEFFQRFGSVHVFEHLVRGAIMRTLLSHRLYMAYLVYGALSPYIERNLDEVSAIVHARIVRLLPDSKVERADLHDGIHSAMDYMVQANFARRCIPLKSEEALPSPLCYDAGMGRHLKKLIARAYPLAPQTPAGEWIRFFAKHRGNLRESVRRYRDGLLGAVLAKDAHDMKAFEKQGAPSNDDDTAATTRLLVRRLTMHLGLDLALISQAELVRRVLVCHQVGVPPAVISGALEPLGVHVDSDDNVHRSPVWRPLGPRAVGPPSAIQAAADGQPAH